MSRHALIVATDGYADAKLSALRAPTADAEALADVLRDPDIGGFDVEVAINAKEAQLRRMLSAFFADRRPDDLLLLHVGCHGVKDDDGRLYFAASDTELAHLDATAVPAEFVNRRMNDSRSRRIVLFLDCCYSGAFARGMAARAGDKVEIRERFEGSGRVVLTASDAMEYSFEGDDRHGEGRRSVFTAALVHGLKSGEADLDQDHLISVDELYDYVYTRVREQTPHQTPGKWSFVTGDVFVARSAYVAPVEVRELPEDLAAMEHSQLPYVREELVERLAILRVQPEFAERARQALERLREDDSRRVAAAAARVLGAPEPAPAPDESAVGAAAPTESPPAVPAAPESPPAVAAPAESPPASSSRAAADLRSAPRPTLIISPPGIVLVGALASAVAGAPVGVLHWQLLTHASDPLSHAPGVIAGAVSGAVSVLVLASLLVLARRSALSAALAVLPPALAAAVLTAPAGFIDAPTRLGFIAVYLIAGVVAGAASLVGTASPRAVALGAAMGAGASVVFAALAPTHLGHSTFVLVYYVLAFGWVGGAIAVAIARSPVRRR